MLETIIAIAPFLIAGSILPTWTVAVIGLLGTERPIPNALAFVGGNITFRLGLGIVLLSFAAVLPDAADLRLDSGAFDPLVPLVSGLVLCALGVAVWRRPAAPEGRAFIDRAGRIKPWAAFVAGFVAVASPGVQYAYFLGGIAVVTETLPGTGARLAALGGFALGLQWMLLVPVAVYLTNRARADQLLARVRTWLRANGPRLAGGILLAAGVYLAAFGFIELRG